MKLFKKHQVTELPTEAVIKTDVQEFEQSRERLNYLAAEEGHPNIVESAESTRKERK